jgi:ankyrin repeat protein
MKQPKIQLTPQMKLVVIVGSSILCVLLILAGVVHWITPSRNLDDVGRIVPVVQSTDQLAVMVISGDISGLQKARKDGAELDEITSQQWSLLHLAAIYGHREIAEWLVEQGLSRTSLDVLGQRPFELALVNGHVELGIQLVPPEDAGAQMEIMVNAIRQGQYDTVEVLLANRKKIDQLTTTGKQSLLHHAARYDQSDILAWLITRTGQVDLIDDNGRTPLHIAAIHNATASAELLIRAKADMNQADSQRYAPLHYAASSGHSAMVECLLRHGADVNQTSPQGTALALALERGQLDLLEMLMASE